MDANGQAVGVQRRVTGEQRPDVPVLPHPLQHEVQRRSVGHHLRILVRALVRPELGGDAIDRRRQHPVQQRLFRHAVVAVRVVWRHAALVAEKDGDPAPLHVKLGQQLVAALGRRAPREDERAGSTAQRLGDLRRRGLRNVLRGGENYEVAQSRPPTLP